jgi:release factor glutamine methyltransferase
MHKDRAWLFAHPDEKCRWEDFSRFMGLVARRQAGEPMAYLTGEREFHSRSFRVSPDVLIPRPETELLVEQAMKLDLPERAKVLDIGTGSGCIAVTLCLERPNWQVTAVDRSETALQVAESNRDCLGARALELLHGSLFEPVRDRRFDLIVSNPPYIASGDEHLSQGDVRFEPDLALVAGVDGLEIIRQIVAKAPDHLEQGGWLLLEHGHDQAAAVRNLLEAAGFEQVGSQRDLAGIERVSFGKAP